MLGCSSEGLGSGLGFLGFGGFGGRGPRRDITHPNTPRVRTWVRTSYSEKKTKYRTRITAAFGAKDKRILTGATKTTSVRSAKLAKTMSTT
jgi:hypothetical protein